MKKPITIGKNFVGPLSDSTKELSKRFVVLETNFSKRLIINLAKLPFFFDLQIFTSTSILLSIVVLPILPIGIYLGKLLNKKLSDRLFYHISHSALFLCGLNLITRLFTFTMYTDPNKFRKVLWQP